MPGKGGPERSSIYPDRTGGQVGAAPRERLKFLRTLRHSRKLPKDSLGATRDFVTGVYTCPTLFRAHRKTLYMGPQQGWTCVHAFDMLTGIWWCVANRNCGGGSQTVLTRLGQSAVKPCAERSIKTSHASPSWHRPSTSRHPYIAEAASNYTILLDRCH